MTVFLISFVVLALAMLGLATGVVLGRAPLAGSCGGLGACRCARPCAARRLRAGNGAG